MISPCRCLPLLAALLLTACSNPRAESIARLRKTNITELRTDVARFHTRFLQSPDQEYQPLKSVTWSEYVQKLKTDKRYQRDVY